VRSHSPRSDVAWPRSPGQRTASLSSMQFHWGHLPLGTSVFREVPQPKPTAGLARPAESDPVVARTPADRLRWLRQNRGRWSRAHVCAVEPSRSADPSRLRPPHQHRSIAPVVSQDHRTSRPWDSPQVISAAESTPRRRPCPSARKSSRSRNSGSPHSRPPATPPGPSARTPPPVPD